MCFLVLKWGASCNVLSPSRFPFSRKSRRPVLCIVYVWHMSHITCVLLLWVIEKIRVVYSCLLIRPWGSWIFADVAIKHLITAVRCSNQDTVLIWNVSTFLSIVQSGQLNHICIWSCMNIDSLALTLLLLLLLLLLLSWVLYGVVCIPLNFLAKKSIFNFQCRIYLWLCWVWIHWRTHLLFRRDLSRQDTLESLNEPTIDCLIVCKLNLSQVDLLGRVHWHSWHDFLPWHAWTFLWSSFRMDRI